MSGEPFAAVADQLAWICRSAGVVSVGAAACCGRPGLSVADGDHAPEPRALAARTCTSYAVALVRLPMVALVPVPVWLTSVHVPVEAVR